MGRIRTVKPEWLTDERLKSASDEARVLSIALITRSDDYGNGEAGDLIIAGAVWSALDPLEALAKASRAIRELIEKGYVQVYKVSGQSFFHIENWTKHQRVDKPGKPLFPGPERADIAVANDSREIREPVQERPGPDHDLRPRPTTTTTTPKSKAGALDEADPTENPKPTPSLSAKTSKPKRPKPQPSETSRKAAEYLRAQILAAAPNCAASRLTPGGLANWARDLDKLEALSPGHTWQAIRESIDWLHTAENTFVVQSAASLAKKWDSIQANRKRSPATGATRPEDPYDRAERLRNQGAR